MLARLRSTTACCCHHRRLFLCSFVLVPTTCLFALVLPLVCTHLVLSVRLPSAHVLTCVCSYWSLLPACLGSFGLVLPLVCTHLVLHVCLPSAHVLTCVRSCSSLLPACSHLSCRWYPLGFAHTPALCTCAHLHSC